MRLHVLQHVSFEGPAKIAEWASARQYILRRTQLFLNEPLPPLDSFDVLVVMGGPMGANDEQRFPWMSAEKQFIGEAIERRKKVLGICLGAQLIASVLGAKVFRNREKEIGWFPIDLNRSDARRNPLDVLPPEHMVFHWHGDTFELPAGARQLARTSACENQAFALGDDVIGLQFHLEIATAEIESLQHHASEDLTVGRYVQSPKEMHELSKIHAAGTNAALFKFLDDLSSSRQS